MPTTILDNESYLEALHRRYAEESRIDRKIEIIAMAKTAGFFEFNVEGWVKEFERFAAIVAANEREACVSLRDKFFNETDDEESDWNQAIDRYAAAIRSRSSEH